MFSFIIPCFNGSAALRNTLSSLAWQNQEIAFEVILVDNNSNRENLDLLYLEFKEQLTLYLIKQPRLKTTYALCRARNIGLSIARNEWIITLDSDIILPPTYLDSLTQHVADQKKLILTGERIFIKRSRIEPLSPERLLKVTPIASASNYNQVEDRRLPFLKKLASVSHPWSFFHGCNTVFRKVEGLAVGGFDENYDGNWGYEDIDFAYRLIVTGACQPVYLPAIYCYHQEEEEMPEIIDRFDKSSNPNWTRICQVIPGYQAFKTSHYGSLANSQIKLND